MVRFEHPRSRHPFHMHDRILGQPAFVRETLHRVKRADARGLVGSSRTLLVTGCGTSFHAAQIGASLLQRALGAAAAVHAVHAYDLLHGFVLPADATVLGVSHSGATSTTNQALALARRAGVAARGLCGLPDAPMSEVAEELVVIGSVHDHSWANTMSYTCQLAAFAALAEALAGEPGDLFPSGTDGIPALLTQSLGCEARVRRLAKRVAAHARVTYLGSGLDEITALEGALKIRETCSLPAVGYHVEQFLHGPFLSLDRREAVVALRSSDDDDRETEILRGLARTGAEVAVLGEAADAEIRLPVVEAALRPILSVVPLQFLAYYAALEREANPDVMRSDVPRYRPGLEPLFSTP